MKSIAETGVKVIVSGGKVGDLALHYANRYKLMIVRLLSKWDLRRLCKSIGATPLPKIVSNFENIDFLSFLKVLYNFISFCSVLILLFRKN